MTTDLACPLIDPEFWASRYDLNPEEGVCNACGAHLVTDTPYTCGDEKGLMSKPHSPCMDEHTLKVSTGPNDISA